MRTNPNIESHYARQLACEQICNLRVSINRNRALNQHYTARMYRDWIVGVKIACFALSLDIAAAKRKAAAAVLAPGQEF